MSMSESQEQLNDISPDSKLFRNKLLVESLNKSNEKNIDLTISAKKENKKTFDISIKQCN